MKKQLIQAVKAVQNGEKEKFAPLYEDFKQPIYFRVINIVGENAENENIVQEIFITAFQTIKSLQNPETFPSWLNKIAVRKCAEFLKKQTAEPEPASADFTEDNGLVPETVTPETAKIIYEVIQKLPLSQRACIYFYYYERLTIAEIATDENTVKSRLAAARETIRAELEKHKNEDELKLYLASPLVLIPIMKFAAANTALPPILAGTTVTTIISAAGTTSTVTTSTAGTAATVTSSTAGTAATSTVSAAGTAATTTAKAGISAKVIIAAVLGAAVVEGGVLFAVNLPKPTEPETVPAILNEDITTTSETETTTLSATTTTTATTTETTTATTKETTTETETEPTETEPPETTTEPPVEPLELDFSNKGITNEKLAAMVADGTIPKNVTGLNLSQNTISNISPLAGLTNLTDLDLSNNEVETGMFELSGISDLSPLSKLIKLKKLDLSYSHIGDITPLKGLTNLTWLNLSWNQLGKKVEDENWNIDYIFDITPLKGLTNLTWLNLAHTNTKDISPLKGLTKLEYLDLSQGEAAQFAYGNNRISDEQLSALKAALPNCKINLILVYE